MTDIVERLREHADFDQGHGHCSGLASEAADEIERLRAEIADAQRRRETLDFALRRNDKLAK